MTPDQRLDRAERMLILFVKAGRRARKASREQDEKIHMLIQAQMETTEQINRLAIGQANLAAGQANLAAGQAQLAAGQAKADKEIAEVRRERKLTFQALRAFIDSQRKEQNGK